MKPCKHSFCPNHQRGIEHDKTAPIIQTINPKDGLTSTITQTLIYSDYCYFHSIEMFGKLKEGKGGITNSSIKETMEGNSER